MTKREIVAQLNEAAEIENDNGRDVGWIMELAEAIERDIDAEDIADEADDFLTDDELAAFDDYDDYIEDEGVDVIDAYADGNVYNEFGK